MLELYKEFQEEAYSVALHPTGLYILVGFSDKLRLMNLLIDNICTFKEFTVRGCREVGYVLYTSKLQPHDALLSSYQFLFTFSLFFPLSVLLATVATCLLLSTEMSSTSIPSPLLRTSSI